MKKTILDNKIIRNASWLMVGKIIQMLIKLIVGLLTARYLGPSNYGLINYAAAYTGFFYAFCTLGINSILVKEIIDAPEDEGVTLGTSLMLRSVSSFLSAIFILFIVMIVDNGDSTTMWVVGLSCIGMIFQVFEIFNYWFQSRLQSKVTAVVALIAYTITSVYKCILIFTGQNVKWFAFATSVDYICIGLLLYFAYRKNNGNPLKISLQKSKDLLSKSYHFVLSSLMVAVYSQTDKIMLRHFMSSAEVGYYSTAVSLCSVWCFVLAAIIDSMYPEIAKVHTTDKKLFSKRNKQLYALVFYISVAVSLIITVFAKLIIWIMYGEAYLPSVAPLRIITWYTAFSYLGVARNAWIVCKNRQKYLKYVYASAAIANVILNLIFIPKFGAVGAAIASLTAQIITTMVAPFFIRGLRENSIMMVEAIFLKFGK